MPYALLFRLEIGWSILYIEEMLVGLDLDRNNVPFFILSQRAFGLSFILEFIFLTISSHALD